MANLMLVFDIKLPDQLPFLNLGSRVIGYLKVRSCLLASLALLEPMYETVGSL